MSPSEDAVQVALVTAPDVETAKRIARTLVDERLVACVNLVPGIRSIFRWEGSVQEEAEVLLIAKTRHDQAAALIERVVALHPYDVPEVLLLPEATGHPAYLDWVRAEARP